MVVLVPDPASADLLARGAGSRSVVVLVVDAGRPVEEAIAKARKEHGGTPLGLLAASEAEALGAIAAGADEAMVLPDLEPPRVLTLLDRTAQRASLRREWENERSSVVQSEKLAALGTVVAGVAHEINNPLAAALLSTELLKNRLGPVFGAVVELKELAARGRAATSEELSTLVAGARAGAAAVEGKQVLDEVMGFIETIAAVVRDLRIYARVDDDDPPDLVNVTDLIERVLRIVGRELTARAAIERDYGDDLPLIVVPRARLVQVLTNVLINAAHAIREVERPLHRVRISVRSDPEAVAVSVTDTGPGIPPESVERIFDPFYTTKREGSGTGLGLSISRSILRRLGGDLVVESVHGEGATFIAIIPLPKAEQLRAALGRSPVPESARPARRAAVLVVNDDAHLLRVYPRILGERYAVLLASDAQEAIDMLSSGSAVDAIVTDLQTREMDGRQLYAWLLEQRPDLAPRTVFVASAAEMSPEFLKQVATRHLEKPLRREELFQAVEAALGQ